VAGLLLLTPLLLIALAVGVLRAGAWRRGASATWRSLLTHQVTVGAYAIAFLLSAILLPSYCSATLSAAQHCELDGMCGVGLKPFEEWSSGSPFREAATSDEDCRAAAWCTAIVPARTGESHPLVFGVLNPPMGKQPEGCKSLCAMAGACSVVGDQCGAKNDADCALTEGCLLWGHCSAVKGTCFPARDEDCAGSRACKVLGRCRAMGGVCRSADHLEVSSEEHAWSSSIRGPFADDALAIRDRIYRCADLDACRDEGLCDVSAADECVVGSDESCKASSGCKAGGACKRWSDNHRAECATSCADTTFCKESGRCVQMADGLCGAGEARDCEESEACRRDGRCALVDGTCQATAEICTTWDGCRFDGRCALRDGACRLTEGACANTIPCAKLGACSPSTTWEGCGVASDADCAGSEVCKKYGWCRAFALGYWPMSTSQWFCFKEPER
jgi:hypothetical protein